MNRIAGAIGRYEGLIAKKLESKEVTSGKLVELSTKLDMEFVEYCKFQELKSLACIDGALSLDEANTVYSFLGNTPEQFNRQPLAVKAVLTQVFEELLRKRMA
jgi:hypothetical protein